MSLILKVVLALALALAAGYATKQGAGPQNPGNPPPCDNHGGTC